MSIKRVVVIWFAGFAWGAAVCAFSAGKYVQHRLVIADQVINEISACESTLARNKTCKTIAVEVSND